MIDSPLPVLQPVGTPPATPRWGIFAAAALGLVIVGFSVNASWTAVREAPPEATIREGPRIRPTTTGPRFGAGTLPRLAALRDRLVAGLLALRAEDGTYLSAAAGRDTDPVFHTEATAMAVAGLAAARWMDSSAESKSANLSMTGAARADLDSALAKAKAALLLRQAKNGEFGAPVQGGRATTVATLSSAILALALAGDPADAGALDAAGKALADEAALGPFPSGWSRGVSTLAALALVGTGHAKALSGDAKTVIFATKDVGTVRDSRDPRVVEALNRRARREDGAAGGFPDTILVKCIETGCEWGGDRTDLYSWCLRAWLAARATGGDAWFALALPALEKAPGGDGSIAGDLYGEPVSRTACALLILLEGWTPQLPFGG